MKAAMGVDGEVSQAKELAAKKTQRTFEKQAEILLSLIMQRAHTERESEIVKVI